MKKILLTLLLLSSFALASNASGIFLKTGLTMGSTNDTISLNNSAKNATFAPSGEIGFELSLSKGISFNFAAGVAFQGLQYVVGDSSVTSSGETKLTYLTVPIDFKAMIPTNSGGIYLTMGPRFDILLAANEILDGTNDVIDGKSHYDNMSVALGFRLGGEIALGKHHFLVESGYDFGISDVLKTSSYKVQTGRLTILAIGIRFNTAMID